MNYQEALDFIYSFVNFETRPASKQTRRDYNLDQIRLLLDRLGNPQERYPTIHIAGTKGKGSTAAMIAAVLQAAGYRTGLYTSPHMHTYRERIRVNEQLISETAVIDWIEEHRSLLTSIPELTTFEITTALGFDTFAREAVDVAVIEVGLGGRLDTTNVITPRLVGITSISLDHTAILGNTLEQIAAEKAGIIKPHIPVVTAPQPPAALAVIQRVAQERHAPLTLVGQDWHYAVQHMTPTGQQVQIHGPQGYALTAWVPLIGEHEAINTAVAVAGLQELRRQSFTIEEEALLAGLHQVQWPGRFEVLEQSPWIILDAAHNEASAQYLLKTLHQLWHPHQAVLVFGTFIDKRVDEVLQVLLPAFEQVIVTQADHPRAAPVDWLQEKVHQQGRSAVAIPDVADALKVAVDLAGPQGLVVVTGSVVLAGAARMAWLQHTDRPLPPHDPPKPARTPPRT